MRLIDADAPELYRKAYVPQDWSGIDSYPTMIEWEDIENAPTIDAAPVVRCKDCKHAVRSKREGILECDMREYDYSPDDGYCFMGERRGEEDE